MPWTVPWVVLSTLDTALGRIIVVGRESGHPRPVITDHGEPVGEPHGREGRSHLCPVRDRQGVLVGPVTLEDLLDRLLPLRKAARTTP